MGKSKESGPDVRFVGRWSDGDRHSVVEAIRRIETETGLRQAWTCARREAAGAYTYRIGCALGQVTVRGDSVDELIGQLDRFTSSD